MHSYELAFRLVTVVFLLVQAIGPAAQKEFIPLIQALAGNPSALAALQSTETETLTPYGPGIPTDTPTFTHTPISSPMPTDTPVYTVIHSPTGTDTETPTKPVTPTETETATPTGAKTETPTSTGTLTLTPTGTVVPGLELALQAQLKQAKPGSIVQFEWKLTGLKNLPSLDGLEMLIQVPAGFFPVSSKKLPDAFGAKGIQSDNTTQVFMLDGTFDANTGIYRMPLAVDNPKNEADGAQAGGDAEKGAEGEKDKDKDKKKEKDILFGKTAWVVDWQAEGPFLIRAELQQAGKGVAGAELALDDGGLVPVSASGGKVRELNDRVEVEFPGGVLPGDAKVRIRPAKDDPNRRKPLGGGGGTVEIFAYDSQTSKKLTKFDSPLTIRFAFDPSLARLEDEYLTVVYWDEEKLEWVGLPTEVDREKFILTAQVDHLSVFDYTTANFDVARLPNLDAFQVSQFTGAATYSYPLVFPAGPGGMQPSASIDYNSQNTDNANSIRQGGLLGMGWDLSLGGAIERNMNGSLDIPFDDTFSITAGGVGGALMPGADGYWHTTSENFWKIAFNEGNNTWTAWDKTGSVYTFSPIGYYPAHTVDGCYIQNTYWYWGLSSVKNIFGREVLYTYYTESRTAEVIPYAVCHERYPMVTAVYPASAVYPDGRTRVIVDYQERHDFDYQMNYYFSPRFFYKKSVVEEIRVERDLDGNGSFETIMKKYTFGYESDQAKRLLSDFEYEYVQGTKEKGQPTLLSITEWGVGGTSHLPSVTFAYENNRLASGNNGYNGKAEFVYEENPWFEMGFDTVDGNLFKDFPISGRNRQGQVNTAWINDASTNYELRLVETDGLTFTTQDLGSNISYMPGAAYHLRARMHGYSTTVTPWIQLGLNDVYGPVTMLANDKTGPGQWVDAFVILPKYAETIVMTIQGDGWQIDEILEFNPVTHYRVKEKHLFDGLSSQPKVWTYRYDGAATNDPAFSENAALPKDNRMGSPYAEYRGNSAVTEIGPDDLATTSWFLQDDVFKGKPVRSMVSLLAFLDPFDVLHAEDWSSATGSGSVEPERTGGDPALKLTNPQSDWGTWASRTSLAIDPEDIPAAVFQFRVSDTSTQALLMLERGSEGSGDYRRWGLWVNQGVVYASYSDGGSIQTSNALLGIGADAWYLGMLIVDDENMYLRIVNRDDPAEAGLFELDTPAAMQNLTWRFKEAVSGGTVWLDEYMETKVYSLNETAFDSDQIDAADYRTETWPIPISPSGLMPINVDLVYPNFWIRGNIEDLKSYWSRPIWQKSYMFDGDGTWVATMKEFQYLTDDQDGTQYGNTTRVIESSWNGSSFVPYRATRMLYYPNASGGTYLVGLPATKAIFSCPGGSCAFDNNTLLNSTWYLYDNESNYATAPSAGKLTGQRILLRWGGGGQSDPRFADMKFAYDGWGNKTSVKMYTGEGTAGSLASSGEQETATAYDSAYHAYPVSTTNALNHTTYLQYDYSLGLPTQQTDPNNAVWTISYDSFGRLMSLRKPGDASGLPTLSAVYYDNWSPFTVILWQKVDTTGGTLEVRRFYDGLGRLVQTQSAASDLSEGERDVVVDMMYDAYGRLLRQTVPYSIARFVGSGSPWRGQDWSKAYTRTEYDALGRVARTIGTDNDITAQFRYDDLDIYATDAMGRVTHTRKDVWGRPVLVDPPAGPSATYDYDPLDRLTSVLIAGKTTTIAYDLAGRKTGMDDPDMGGWAYAYDALGNLTSQTDARGCVSSLTYDLLNRLTRKDFSGPGQCATTPAVAYGYDQGANGIGRRTSMTDATGSTAWTYDSRGRMTGQSKTVTGYGTYATAYGYGSADQLLWIRYPGDANGELGEKVDYTYTEQLTLDSVAGTSVYVADTHYDAAGRIDLRTYIPDALETDYSYYAWNAPGGAGRLLSIATGSSADPDSMQSLTYTYDVMGNIIRIDDLIGGAIQSQFFTYDNLDRLTGARVEGGTLGLYDPQEYIYDDAGRLSGKDGSTYGYQDPSHTHAVTHVDGFQLYWFDANGNQTKRIIGQDTYDLYYNAEGRLVRVDKNGVLWSTYLYDGDGAMVVKTEDGKTTLYIGNLLEIDTAGGGTPSTPTATRTPSSTKTPTLTPSTSKTITSTPSNSPTRTLTRTASPTKTYTPTPTVFNGTGLLGQYYFDANLGEQVKTQVDPMISFSWAPAPEGFPADDWSIRWTGWVKPNFTGDYTFYVQKNGGVRLSIKVNGQEQLIINSWVDETNEKTSSTVSLTAGVWYPIKLEYFDDFGDANVYLRWSGAQQKKDLISPNYLKPCTVGGGDLCPPLIPTPTPTITQANGVIPRTLWTLKYVDNQQAGAAASAFDGNNATMWSQKWTDPIPPLPHEIQIDLGMLYDVRGFRYLPRQDGYANGRIGQYEFYVSADGVNWGTPVTTGTFPDTAAEKEIIFTAKMGRYVRLRALTEAGNRCQQSVVAELNVLGSAVYPVDNPIPKDDWSLKYVDNQIAGYEGGKAFDGISTTMWVTKWTDPPSPLPHEIQIDLEAFYSITGFRYWPRRDGYADGRIGQYELYISLDGVNWGTPVMAGTFPDTAGEKEVRFAAITGRYIRFRALTEAGNDKQQTVVAELSLLGESSSEPTLTPTLTSTPTPTLTKTPTHTNTPIYATIPRTMWTVKYVDNQQAGAAANAFDGNNATMWSQKWTDPIPPLPHEIQIDLGMLYDVQGFRYLPRQDGIANGRIGQYEFYVSSDGVNWGTPVATGTFADTAAEKEVIFTTKTGRFIRLRALTEAGNRCQQSVVAELNVLGTAVYPAADLISRAGWSLVYVDNQAAGAAVNTFDGNPQTVWSQKWTDPIPPLPHEIQIDLGAVHVISGFRYLTRQDGIANGRIGQYEFYISSDGVNWGTPVITGVFPDNAVEKEVRFAAVTGRYIRFRALTEAGNRCQQSVVAEINVLGTEYSTPTPTPTISPSSTPTNTHTPTPTTQMPSGQVWKTYYYAGSQRVAVRVTGSANPQENGLFYTVGDHLGSTSLVVDSAGNKASEKRYTPWGETRHQGGTPPTDYGYTGQREEAGIGLYYYNARWYDAKLGRFLQGDALVPSYSSGNEGINKTMSIIPLTVDFTNSTILKDLQEENSELLNFGSWFQLNDGEREQVDCPYGPKEVISLDRFSYVKNNPLKFNDPTGNEWRSAGDENLGYWWNDDTGEIWFYYNGNAIHYNLNDVDNDILGDLMELKQAVELYDASVKGKALAVISVAVGGAGLGSSIATGGIGLVIGGVGLGLGIVGLAIAQNGIDSALATAEQLWPRLSDPNTAGMIHDPCNYRQPPKMTL